MKRHRRSGFSALEILIAMGILSIGVIAVMKLFPMSLRQARVAQEQEIAAELADSRLGRVKTLDAQHLLWQGQRGSSLLNQLSTAGQSYGIYQGFYTSVQNMGGAAEVGLQRVRFAVEMNDGRSETYVTYVARR